MASQQYDDEDLDFDLHTFTRNDVLPSPPLSPRMSCPEVKVTPPRDCNGKFDRCSCGNALWLLL